MAFHALIVKRLPIVAGAGQSSHKATLSLLQFALLGSEFTNVQNMSPSQLSKSQRWATGSHPSLLYLSLIRSFADGPLSTIQRKALLGWLISFPKQSPYSHLLPLVPPRGWPPCFLLPGFFPEEICKAGFEL